MKKFLLLTSLLFPSLVFADTTQPDAGIMKPGIVEDRSYWNFSVGHLYQPLPHGEAHMAKLSVGRLYVDESLIHAFQLELGLGDSQTVSFNYGFGVGPREGWFHVGLLVGLGYAHFYEDGHIHGLCYRVAPFADFMLLRLLGSSWRFYVSVGTAGIAVSNGDYSGTRSMGGVSWEIGAAFSWD
ncbi:hypothetical protein KKA33_04460 [Patescibacteria group bacterium]|nr:hypothetical protein [Patescibacteria group bacterium]